MPQLESDFSTPFETTQTRNRETRMNAPNQERSGANGSRSRPDAPGDFLLPWADPYIANLQRRYQLDPQRHLGNSPDAASTPRNSGPSFRNGFGKQKATGLRGRYLGWFLCRTAPRAPVSRYGF